MKESLKSKILMIYGSLFLSLLVTMAAAYVAVDTQKQHLILNELLSKQKLLIERVTFTTINASEKVLYTLNSEAVPTQKAFQVEFESLEGYSKSVDFMLTAFQTRAYPLDGKSVKLKFSKSFEPLFNVALKESVNQWHQIKSETDWLLTPIHLVDKQTYENRLIAFKRLNAETLNASDYLTNICGVEAARKRAFSTQIQWIAAIFATALLLTAIHTIRKDLESPMNQMKQAFTSLGSGKFNFRMPLASNKEFNDLFTSFNQFADSLQAIRDIETKIMEEDRLEAILSIVKTQFEPFAPFDSITVIYRDSTFKITTLQYDGHRMEEQFAKGMTSLEGYVNIDENTLVLPIMVNQRLLGYVELKSAKGFSEISKCFLETLEKPLGFAIIKSLLFKDLLSIVTAGLADLAESRDTDTRHHLTRMSQYASVIAEELSMTKDYANIIDNEFITNLVLTAPMHDIGKVAVPDHILLKPGKLTAEEFDIMKQHAHDGAAVLRNIHERFSLYNMNYFNMADEIAHAHQEKFDGSGYPRGLVGNEIPLSARISALADVFDALTTKRPYKDAFTIEKSYEIITESSGRHFDPEIVKAFVKARKKIELIHSRYS